MEPARDGEEHPNIAPLTSNDNNSSTRNDVRSDSHRISARGASAITNQVRLGPKKYSEDRGNEDNNFLRTKDEDFGESGASGRAFTLQPVDEGFGAWSYVASAFAMYIVVWGFPNSFPIFQTHLSSGEGALHPDSLVLPLLAPGIQDIQEGIMFQFLPSFVRYLQLVVIVGICIIPLSLFLASCASTPWQIILSQGVLFGVGGIMLNFAHVTAFSSWFDKKRSQAMGLIWLGYRFGALAFPLICQWLLDTHGFTTTLRVLIAPMLALLIPCVFLLRGRYPAAVIDSLPAKPKISKITALRAPKVAFYLLVSTIFNLVVYVPLTFITKVGADIGVSKSDQVIAQSLLILSLMLGTYVLAKLSDTGFNPIFLSLTSLISSLVHFLLLGFCKNRITLFCYAIAIGLASGGFDNSLFAFYAEVAANDAELFTTVHSLFSFCRGLATLSVGSVGVALIRLSPPLDVHAYGLAKYQYLVIYAGSMTFLCGILVLLYTRLHRRSQKDQTEQSTRSNHPEGK
ncbi:MAG: hypothetical protein Q9160_008143 [Pyrenula sp. 1 TL-2023]